MIIKNGNIFISVLLFSVQITFSLTQEDQSTVHFDYANLYHEFGAYNVDKASLVSQFQENFLNDIKSQTDINNYAGEQLLMATYCLARHQSNLVKIFLSEQEQRSAIITKKDAFQKVLNEISCYNVLKFIFQHGPSEKKFLESKDERGWNALHMAVEFGFKEVVDLFLKNRMNPANPISPSITIQTEEGTTLPYFAEMTALHLATVTGDQPIVELLLQYNADVEAKDYFGRTSLDIAKILYNVDHPIVQLLKQQSTSQEQSTVHEKEGYSHLDTSSQAPSKERNTESNGGWQTKLDVPLINKFGQIPCQVTSIEAQELRVEMFLRDFVSLKRPLRVLQGASSWPATQSWTKNKFKQSYGSLKVDAGAIPYGEIFGMEHKLIKIGDFMRLMDSSIEQETEDSKPVPNYIFDHEVLSSSSRSLIKRDYEFHPVFRSVWKSFQQLPQFFLGGPKTGAPFHYHCHAVNGIAWGTKRWFLIPPSVSFYSKEPVWEWVARQDEKELDRYGFQCIQEASDVLYVPSFWTHAVLNLKSSVGAAVETDAMYC